MINAEEKCFDNEYFISIHIIFKVIKEVQRTFLNLTTIVLEKGCNDNIKDIMQNELELGYA